jgi:hypothetical protein
MMHCVQCSTELVAPERSEYRSDRQVCHIWCCPKCHACFDSLVSLPTDNDAMLLKNILGADPSLFPALLVA